MAVPLSKEVEKNDARFTYALGFGGDDADDVASLMREVCARRRTLSSTAWVCQRCTLSDLFKPSAPVVESDGVIVWSVCRDGLSPMLEVPGRRAELMDLFRGSGMQQWLIVDDAWRRDTPLEIGLRDLGVRLWQARGDDAVLAEVRRPDGLLVFGFACRDDVIYAPDGGARPLHRAPRWRRLLLDPTNAMESALRELPARKMLLFPVGNDKRPVMMQWPGHGLPFLPVFGDTSSLLRAGHETGCGPGMGGMPGGALVDWARTSGFGLALGAYPDAGKVRYLALDVPTLGTVRRLGG